jgi:hypothetical protein
MSNTGYVEVVAAKRLAASGVVGDSGKPIDVVGYSILSGATAAVPYFIDGTSASGTIGWRDQARATSSEQSIALAYAVRMEKGLFVSFDANTTAVTVFYRQMLT